ncbi:MAG TPA: hypothetical protein PLU47_00805 [Azonexus sp.]|nr:hypothetical protein [Azonexus sp.]
MTFLVAATSPIAGKFVVKKYAGWGILGADIPTTGDNGGSPVLNDSINPTSEYHWRVETPPSAGVLTIYPDLTFEWDGTGVPDGSYPWVYRLFEDGVSVGTATVSQMVGALSLVIARAAHGHVADSLTLSVTSSASLAVQDALHGHKAGTPSLTAQWLLSIADSLHAHAADNVALATTGSAILAIAEAAHVHSADSLTLTTQWLLAIADALHAQSADNAALDTSNAVWLTLQDATHGHAAEGVILTMSNWLAIADSLLEHHADTVQIDIGQRTLAIAAARHLHLADRLLLSLPGSGLTSDSKFIISMGARILTVVAHPRSTTIDRWTS